jgi:hypothetical protein
MSRTGYNRQETEEELIDDVNEAGKLGWIPIGSPTIVMVPPEEEGMGHKYYFCQALVDHEREK